MNTLHRTLQRMSLVSALLATPTLVAAQPAEPPPQDPGTQAPPEPAPPAEGEQPPAGEAEPAPPTDQEPAPPPAEEPPAASPEQPAPAPAEPAEPPAAAAAAPPPGAPIPSAQAAAEAGSEAEAPPAPVPEAFNWPATPAAPADAGVSDEASDASKPKKSRWRLSRLSLDQSVTAQTLGVGEDYQSDNPTYDWTLQLRPRYYFLDRETWSYHVQATIGGAQELTNSDGTTGRRELDAEDSLLALRYDRLLYQSGRYLTALGVALPEFGLPTSRGSRNNGRILGLGASLIPSQVVPLTSGPFFPSFAIAGLLRYQHFFTEAKVPTSDELTRPRTDLGGRPVISDQLGSAAFPEHEARFGFTTELLIHERVGLISDFQWRPTWNYELDREAEVCLVTGCTRVESVEDPQTYELVTAFATEVETRVMDEMSVSVGYQNLASQIGPDGQRRNMFYSPNARFYVTVTAYLAEIFDKNSATAPINEVGFATGSSAF